MLNAINIVIVMAIIVRMSNYFNRKMEKKLTFAEKIKADYFINGLCSKKKNSIKYVSRKSLLGQLILEANKRKSHKNLN